MIFLYCTKYSSIGRSSFFCVCCISKTHFTERVTTVYNCQVKFWLHHSSDSSPIDSAVVPPCCWVISFTPLLRCRWFFHGTLSLSLCCGCWWASRERWERLKPIVDWSVQFLIWLFDRLSHLLQGMNSSFFVLLMEWLPPSRRRVWAAMSELSFAVGVLALTLAAYLLQNWIYIQAFLSVCCITTVPLIW